MTKDNLAFLQGNVVDVARQLLGCELVATIDNKTVRLKIVETEAYHQADAASHSYKGKTPRTDIMFGEAGHLYVYLTYGMHYCMNIVTGKKNEGSAVLIRAAQPLEGWSVLQANRPGVADAQLTNGPGKLCKAMKIDKTWNGHDLHTVPLQLETTVPIPDKMIVQTTRIGISKARDTPWRFYIKDNQYVSRTA